MREPTYQQAIAKAWQVVWHHKILWILGLVAAFLGQFGLGDFFGRMWLIFFKDSASNDLFWVKITKIIWPSNLDWQNIVGIAWLGLLVLVICLAVVVVAVVSQGALIAYTTSWFKSSRYSNISKAWHKGVEHFWGLLGINVLYKLVMVLLLCSAGSLLKMYYEMSGLWIMLILVFVLSGILLFYLIISIVYIYALGYVIVDNKKMGTALESAWKLFGRHILVSFEVGIFLMLLNLLLVVVLASSLLVAFFPSLLIWLVAGYTNIIVLSILGLIIGMLLWLILLVLISGFFNAFGTGAWMYLFIKMHKEGVSSRMVHYVKKLFGRG